MKERPILFSAPMVRAILAGSKTQTRRIVRTVAGTRGVPLVPLRGSRSALYIEPNGLEYTPAGGSPREAWPADRIGEVCPYGAPGDRLWVRETWAPVERAGDHVDGIRFRADDAFIPIENTREAADRWVVAANNDHSGKWRPSIFMRRWASRLTLEVTSVRVERLQEITDQDARAEGCFIDEATHGPCDDSARDVFEGLWSDINGAASWAANPWVWVVGFRRVEADAARGAA